MLLNGVAQWFLAKLLEAPKDQMVRTGTEACDWFVAYPQSDQRGLVEIEGKTRFGARASPSTSPTRRGDWRERKFNKPSQRTILAG